MDEMVLASLAQIWHLIPIVIAIILFKKFIGKKDKNRKININPENEKNGLSLESRAGKKYEKSGYKVTYNETQDGKKELGIDLICCKDDKILLIQCTNYSKSKSITDKDIKTFHSNATQYVKTNEIENKNVEFRYVILHHDVLHKSAIKILTNDSYNCKYVII
jgi:hypothetical protein